MQLGVHLISAQGPWNRTQVYGYGIEQHDLAVTAPSRRRVYQFRHLGRYGFGFRVTGFECNPKHETRNPKPVSRVIPPGFEPGTL